MSSFAACLALIERGIKPLVVDYGRRMPNQISTNLNDNKILKKIFSHNYKTFYGNSFSTDGLEIDNIEGMEINNSYAYGGLANIWGSVVDDDIKTFSKKNFLNIEHIKKIFLHIRKEIKTIPSNYFYNDNLNLKKLNLSNTIKITTPLLAIDKNKCTKCNKCLFGCEYEAIFNPNKYFHKWANEGKIEYLPDVFVSHVTKNKTKLLLSCTINDRHEVIHAQKVLSGLGAINSSKLLLRSRTVDRVLLKSSTYYLIPFFSFKKFHINEENHSLTKKIIFIRDKNLLNKISSFQIYTNNLYIKKYIKFKFKFLPNFVVNFLSNYIILGQGFINHEASDIYEFWMNEKKIKSRNIKFSENIISYVIKIISSLFNKNNIYKLPTIKILNGAYSYHFGASFPMRNKPNRNQSSTLGVLNDLNNFHLIDSSVLNEIPAGSPSIFIMINAYRIASSL